MLLSKSQKQYLAFILELLLSENIKTPYVWEVSQHHWKFFPAGIYCKPCSRQIFTACRKAIISVGVPTLVWKPLECAVGNVWQKPFEWKNTTNSPTFASNYQPSNGEYTKSEAVHVQLQTPGLHVPITARLSHHQLRQ